MCEVRGWLVNVCVLKARMWKLCKLRRIAHQCGGRVNEKRQSICMEKRSVCKWGSLKNFTTHTFTAPGTHAASLPLSLPRDVINKEIRVEHNADGPFCLHHCLKALITFSHCGRYCQSVWHSHHKISQFREFMHLANLGRCHALITPSFLPILLSTNESLFKRDYNFTQNWLLVMHCMTKKTGSTWS